MPDLSDFRPKNANELFDKILEEIGAKVGGDFTSFQSEVKSHLKSVAQKAWKVKIGLEKGTISPPDADLALHTQELALNNILLYVELMPYVLAQDVLETVFAVIAAAIKNLTGVPLKF